MVAKKLGMKRECSDSTEPSPFNLCNVIYLATTRLVLANQLNNKDFKRRLPNSLDLKFDGRISNEVESKSPSIQKMKFKK